MLRPSLRWMFTSLLALTIWPAAARADQYFMVIISYQSSILNLPSQSHTFASFIAADDAGNPLPDTRFDISWLPRTGVVHLFAKAEVGHNFSLEESLALGAKNSFGFPDLSVITDETRMRRIGPVQVDAAFFQKAHAQHERLTHWGEDVGPANAEAAQGNINSDDGSILVAGLFYRAMDLDSRMGNWESADAWRETPYAAVNCIHAVSDIGGYKPTSNARGFAGGRAAARWLETQQPGGHFPGAADSPMSQKVAHDWTFQVKKVLFHMDRIPVDH